MRDLSNLTIAVDLAGCPNRCRHCWLGSPRNGNMDGKALIEVARMFRESPRIKNLGVASWTREPDYRDDYRELWELEKALSDPDMAQRYELLSTWRLTRDEGYARWAAEVGPKVCQITFFGMEETTDWFMRRKGAFRDQLKATEACLNAGIAPRWQLFPTKKGLRELDDFLRLMDELQLFRRSPSFEVFINSASPEGNGWEIESLRLEEADLRLIPHELVDISRDGLDGLGRPERALIEEMRDRADPSNLDATFQCLFVDADLDVYPNIAECTPWWRLGNLRTDGVESVLGTYQNEKTPGQRANRTIPIRELAGRFGNGESARLYAEGDLLTRFLRQWGLSLSS
jgi:hypothetical protein